MELIYFPRIGLDGITYTRDNIESRFAEGIADKIKEELGKITPHLKKEERCLEF